MFVALLSDRLGADSVMLAALTAFMAAEIITIEEGLVGFSNEGLLTVLVLFVVAEGISKTGVRTNTGHQPSVMLELPANMQQQASHIFPTFLVALFYYV
jgi:di/tricarboxylate transporter